jgi:hypothetical protein
MAYVLGDDNKGETWIEAHGRKHRIQFSVNQIKQEPIVNDDIKSRSRITTGTRITMFWPDTYKAEIKPNEINDLLIDYIWVNPHLDLQYTVDGETVFHDAPSNPGWTKYRACDATSAHWYSLGQFERYAGALIARDQEQRRASRKKYTVREFVAQFRGMSATEKQREVLRELGASHMTLARFFGSETEVNHRRMEKLRCLLQEHTRPVRPESLGVIGEEHLRQMIVNAGGEPKSFKYVASPGHANGVPYMVEIAICPYQEWVTGKDQRQGRVLITGVNFSATLENPFSTFRGGMEGMDELLVELRAGPNAPVIVCVHYACPHIEYLDRGKSRIGLE